MTIGRTCEPPLDPPDPDWAEHFYRNLTRLNRIKIAQLAREDQDDAEPCWVGSVGAPLEEFSRPDGADDSALVIAIGGVNGGC